MAWVADSSVQSERVIQGQTGVAARRVVGHDIEISWDETSQVAVSVLVLVSASWVAQAGGRTFRRDGPFVHA